MRVRPRFKRPSVQPALLAVLAEGFLSRLSFGIVGFALPLYAHHLGMGLGAIGLLSSLNVAAEMALKPVLGARADRIGLKRSLSLAIALRSAVVLLLSVAWLPWQLFAIRILHGGSESLRDPAVNAIIAERERKTVASAFAWYSTAKNVAGSIGKAVSGILLTLTAANYPLVFLVAVLLSALPLYTVVRFVREPEAEPPAAPAAADAGDDAPAAAGTARVLPFVGLGTLISGTAAMLHSLFPVLATKYAGLSEAEAGMIYAISTTLTVVAGPVFGWLSDNVSRKLVLAVRSVANTVSSLVYVAAPSFAGVAAGKVVDDLGKAAFRPAWGALMAQIASFDRTRRARTMALMSVGENVGELSGPLLAGLIWQTWGVTAVLLVRATLALGTEAYAFFLPRPPEPDVAAVETFQPAAPPHVAVAGPSREPAS